MASMTVRPKASNRAGCTNTPLASAMAAIEFATLALVQALAQPAQLAIELVLVHEGMHAAICSCSSRSPD
jgi:hypothetical protein